MNEQHRAFVIMPFDPEFTAIHEELILPVLEDAGYQVKRPDSLLINRTSCKTLCIASLPHTSSSRLVEIGKALCRAGAGYIVFQ